MVAPVLQRKQVHLFTLLLTPAIYRSDYREVAWAAKVERKKIPFPKQELSTCWLRRTDFPVIQKIDIISPLSSHSQSSENIDLFAAPNC